MDVKIQLYSIGYLAVALVSLGLAARYVFNGDSVGLAFSFVCWPVFWPLLLLILFFVGVIDGLERYVTFCRKGKRSRS